MLLLLPVILIVTSSGMENSAVIIMLLLAGTVPFMAMLMTSVNTLSKGRLGVTCDQIVLGSATRSQRHFYPRQIVYGSRFISSGDITVFTATGKGVLYDAEEFRAKGWINPIVT
jgi:hypothetical protein